MAELGKGILVFGLVLAVLGGGLLLAARLGLPLGWLPGDISYRGKNIAIFFPLGTSIVASIVLSLIFFIFSRLHK